MPLTALSTYRYKLYYTGFWILWSGVHAWVLQELGYSARNAWADSVISNGLLAITGLLVIVALSYYLPRKDQVTSLLLLCIAFTLAWVALTRISLFQMADETVYTHFNETIQLRGAIGFLILGCVVLLSVLWHSQEDQKEQERRKNESDRIARDAELFKLRQQLQPHFLFNSLNSISALVATQPSEARKMIQQLSDYLRSTLKKEEHTWVTLAEELEYLQLYLDIEKVRFGHRLSTKITSNEHTPDCKLPALLLQPVVENAIKFGLYDTTENITIGLHTDISDKLLVITVENPFDSSLSQPKTGTGFGLSSVQRRLYLLFARNDLLETAAKENIFITRIKIPQQ
ncbi:MAG: histidine kinase [Chitinophagaceae bacterium]|nr:histidine kinase [Chitinophagaceae bacterium]